MYKRNRFIDPGGLNSVLHGLPSCSLSLSKETEFNQRPHTLFLSTSRYGITFSSFNRPPLTFTWRPNEKGPTFDSPYVPNSSLPTRAGLTRFGLSSFTQKAREGILKTRTISIPPSEAIPLRYPNTSRASLRLRTSNPKSHF